MPKIEQPMFLDENICCCQSQGLNSHPYNSCGAACKNLFRLKDYFWALNLIGLGLPRLLAEDGCWSLWLAVAAVSSVPLMRGIYCSCVNNSISLVSFVWKQLKNSTLYSSLHQFVVSSDYTVSHQWRKLNTNSILTKIEKNHDTIFIIQ